MDHQTGRFQLRRHIRQFELQGLKFSIFGQTAGVRPYRFAPLHGRPRRRANRRDVDRPRQALHGDLEALASSPTRLLFGTRQSVNMTARRLTVPAHFAFLGAEGQTGRVLLDQNAGNTASPSPPVHAITA